DARGDVAAGDRRGAGAAVGLEHVAVDPQGAWTEAIEVEAGAQRAADEALDLGLPPVLLADGPLDAARGGPGQHAVFGGEPAALVLAKGRDLVLGERGAEHARAAPLDEDRGERRRGPVGGDRHG